MKNISNLDIKRHRLGLTKDISSLALLELYKKASSKVKLEILGLIEVLRHTEKNYLEAISLIYKLERVSDSLALISKLSKQQLDSKILAATERLSMKPKQMAQPSPLSPPSSKAIKPPVTSFSFFKEYKIPLLSIATILVIGIFIANINPKISAVPKKVTKKETVIYLTPKRGQKFVSTRINKVLTTFLLDTGASATVVSQAYLNTHIRSGFIDRTIHFLRNQTFVVANGERVLAEVWEFPSIIIGPKTLYNVEVAVMKGIDESNFLLGMSTINKLGNPTIDLNNNKIIINN
tara:strand:- start:63 stop:938 length:876 start_codon:yes stop_codon:yes gene_type:complete